MKNFKISKIKNMFKLVGVLAIGFMFFGKDMKSVDIFDTNASNLFVDTVYADAGSGDGCSNGCGCDAPAPASAPASAPEPATQDIDFI